MNNVSTTRPAPPADQNPFSASRVRPGAIPFLFAGGESAGRLIEALRANRWRGAIIGPHGSGKSTLLQSLVPLLEDEGKQVVEINLRAAASPDQSVAEFLRRAGASRRSAGAREAALIIVDGYEQLACSRRWRLLRCCAGPRAGLLVTAHRPTCLPTLLITTASLQTARQVVQRLLPPGDATITDADVEECFYTHQGNMRETLFALYDVYQRRRQRAGADNEGQQNYPDR